MATEPRALTLVTDASRMLAEARTLDDIRHVHNLAQRAHDYAKAARLGLDAQNSAAAIRLESEAKAGELLVQMEKDGQRRGRGAVANVDGVDIQPMPTLDAIGVTRDESSAWQAVAKVPTEKRNEYVAQSQEAESEVTRAGLLKYATTARLAPLMARDSDEWMTPQAVVARVLRAFPVIDLDPCAERTPTKNVPATRHYTAADDGLSRPWHGRVFANPPYSRVPAFAEKLGAEAEGIAEAIVLVPSRTETRWWRAIPASVVCFFDGRLRFTQTGDDTPAAPAPFPSAALYVGPDSARFEDAFGDMGLLYRRVEP